MTLLAESGVLDTRFKAPSSIEEGYDLDQIDFFPDEVAETIAQLTAQKAELESGLKEAQTRIAELENSGAVTGRDEVPLSTAATAPFTPVGGGAARGGDTNAVAGMLALTQQLHDEYINDGKAEADRVLAEANTGSQRIITEAEEQRDRTLTQLEQEHGLLKHRTSELRDFERDYRTRLKSYPESLLADVESGSTPPSDQHWT